MGQEELIYKLSMFEQQMQQIQQQMQLIDNGIIELKSLSLGLDDLNGSNGKEMLSTLGRGIFVKTKLLSEELIVDVGNKNFVKKTIPQTKELIDEQVGKLEQVKVELGLSLEEMNKEIEDMINNAQLDQPEGEEKEHVHSANCKHEH